MHLASFKGFHASNVEILKGVNTSSWKRSLVLRWSVKCKSDPHKSHMPCFSYLGCQNERGMKEEHHKRLRGEQQKRFTSQNRADVFYERMEAPKRKACSSLTHRFCVSSSPAPLFIFPSPAIPPPIIHSSLSVPVASLDILTFQTAAVHQ